MVTGYEVDQYRDIGRIARALERIAISLEQLVQQSKVKKSSVEDDFPE